MTLTATPKVVQPQKYLPPSMPQSTSPAQPAKRDGTQVPHGAASGKKGGRNGKGYRNSAGPGKTQPTQDYCKMCDNNDHPSFLCHKFVTASDRRAELIKKKCCPECASILDSNHRCHYKLCCYRCGKQHKSWLCNELKSNASTKGDSSPST